MAKTQDDLDALNAVLNSGVQTVEADGKRVTYQPPQEMRQQALRLTNDLNKAAGVKRTRRFLPYAVKGF